MRADTAKVIVNTYTYTNTLTMSYIPKGLNLLTNPKPEALLTSIQNILYLRARICVLHSYWHSKKHKKTTLSADVS